MRRLAVAVVVLAAELFARRATADEPEIPVEVIVRDAKLRRASRRDPSAASTVVRREELGRPGADAADVLARVPGVQLSESGSSTDLATASLRGATSAQTPIYLAGIRLNDDVTGTADLSTVPLWMLDRVEVFRGSTPEEVDRTGAGGAILFEPRLPERATLGGGLGLGSFGERFAFVGGGAAGPAGGSLVAVRRAHADNDYRYVDDAGTLADESDDRTATRENADSDSWEAWAVGRTALDGGGRITTVMNAFRREQGSPGISVIPARHARARVERVLGGLSARLPCRTPRPGEPLGGCELDLVTSALVTRNVLRDPRRELALGAPEVTSRGERVATQLHLIHRLGERIRLRAGASREAERLRIDPLGGSGIRARREVGRADASLRLEPAPAVELIALGALECHGTDGPSGGPSTGERCGVLAPTGRLGTVVQASPALALLANLGRAVRVPTLGELYGASAVVLGNPGLDPESAFSADLGARLELAADRTAALSAQAFLFARWSEDLIAYRRSGLGVIRPYNVGRARTLGAELSAAAELVGHLRLEAAATLLDPRDVTESRQLTNDLIPFQSRLTAYGRAELYAEPSGWVNRVALGASLRHRSSRVADQAGLVVIGEQRVLDADVGAWLWQRRLAVRAAIENLLDARRFDAVGYPLPGRTVHASTELWWW